MKQLSLKVSTIMCSSHKLTHSYTHDVTTHTIRHYTLVQPHSTPLSQKHLTAYMTS